MLLLQRLCLSHIYSSTIAFLNTWFEFSESVDITQAAVDADSILLGQIETFMHGLESHRQVRITNIGKGCQYLQMR